MPLNNDELRSVLVRAAEIQYADRPGGIELEKFIAEAEKAGYTRAALERALREKFGRPEAPPNVGELAFARSADGRYYVAKVLAQTPETTKVQFLSGGEKHVEGEDLRAFSLMPGERVSVAWPGWGNWSCTVIKYDAEYGTVNLSDRWGSEALFPISAIWIEKPTPGQSRGIGHIAMLASAIAGSVALGAALMYAVLR
jgi:hypothetical protein